MKIFSDDGRKFDSVYECNAYEADLKAKEEAEKTAKLKEKQQLFEQVRNKIKELNQISKVYEDSTNEHLTYVLNAEGISVTNDQAAIDCINQMVKIYEKYGLLVRS